jgi:hypothetical protein
MKEYDSYQWYHPIGIYNTITGTTVDDYVKTKLPEVDG